MRTASRATCEAPPSSGRSGTRRHASSRSPAGQKDGARSMRQHRTWYDRKTRRTRGLSCGDTHIYSDMEVRRVACPGLRHGEARTARLPGYTRRFAYYVGHRCRASTIKDVAKDLHLDWTPSRSWRSSTCANNCGGLARPAPGSSGSARSPFGWRESDRAITPQSVRNCPRIFPKSQGNDQVTLRQPSRGSDSIVAPRYPLAERSVRFLGVSLGSSRCAASGCTNLSGGTASPGRRIGVSCDGARRPAYSRYTLPDRLVPRNETNEQKSHEGIHAEAKNPDRDHPEDNLIAA